MNDINVHYVHPIPVGNSGSRGVRLYLALLQSCRLHAGQHLTLATGFIVKLKLKPFGPEEEFAKVMSDSANELWLPAIGEPST